MSVYDEKKIFIGPNISNSNAIQIEGLNMSNIGKTIYEMPEYWEEERYKSIEYERATATINWLPNDANTVLDVGCGNGFITNLISKPLVIGVDRSDQALLYVKKLKCKADLCNLPFKSSSFETVLCSEVIEHIPYQQYHRALSEISRVASKYILLTVPYREDRQAVSVTCPECGCSFHHAYHMRSFDENDLKNLFFTENWKFTLVELSTISKVETMVFQTVLKKVLQKITLDFPHTTICPLCGYKISPKITTNYSNQRRSMIILVKKHLKKIWPKRLIPKWWIGLYKKAN